MPDLKIWVLNIWNSIARSSSYLFSFFNDYFINF